VRTAEETISPRLSPKEKSFPVERIRQDFPLLHTQVYGKPLVYLDNAATTQKPQSVIDCITRYYENENANITSPKRGPEGTV